MTHPRKVPATAGPERELLKLLAHPAPEVRGLTLLLIEKIAKEFTKSTRAALGGTLRDLSQDPDSRLRTCAKRAEKSLRSAEKKKDSEKLIPTHGHYEELESYRTTEIIYHGTVAFCDRFISLRSRTHDQMVQAARSGKQNIVEGCAASGTSRKMELKLVGVARASLDELLEDYLDFLKHRNLPVWDKDDPQTTKIRKLAYDKNKSYETYRSHIEKASPEVAANTLLCLVNQANYLLDRQIKALEDAFLEEGGFTERLYRLRKERRDSKPYRD